MNAYTLEIFSGILAPLATVFYIIGIVRGQVRPQKATWTVWLIVVAITAFAMHKEGTLNLQMVGVLASDVVIVLLTFRFGNAGWSKLDIVCLAISAIAIGLWLNTGDAILALGLALTATIIASFPTFVNAWVNPNEEPVMPWGMMVVSTILLLSSISEWNFETAGQPIVYLFTSGTIFLLVLRKYIPRSA